PCSDQLSASLLHTELQVLGAHGPGDPAQLQLCLVAIVFQGAPLLGQPVSGLRVSVLDAEGLRSLGNLFPSTAHRGLCLAGVSGRSDRNAVVPECELTRG